MTNVGNNGQPGNEKARENFTDSFRKILLIEGDAADARLIRGALADARGAPSMVPSISAPSSRMVMSIGEPDPP